MVEEKKAIGAYAASLIEEGDTVVMTLVQLPYT